VSARPEGIEAIHDLVQSLWLQGPTISATDRMRFETAVIEVASNIVKHATAGGPGPEEVTIELMLTAEPDRVTARFCDDGRAANVDLVRTQMPGTEAEFGRGMPLARVLVDELTYERSVSTNIWTLTCLRASPQGATR
jgi:serine/threonine-protein kinase RsbW